MCQDVSSLRDWEIVLAVWSGALDGASVSTQLFCQSTGYLIFDVSTLFGARARRHVLSILHRLTSVIVSWTVILHSVRSILITCSQRSILVTLSAHVAFRLQVYQCCRR